MARFSNDHTFKLILFGLSLTSLLFAFRDIADLDIWWHLAAGRWMVENTSIITKDVFSYTFFNSAWVSITWGYEIIMYALYSVFDKSLFPLVALHALLAAGSIFFSFLTFKVINKNASKEKLYGAAIFYLAILWILELRWNHRAEMISYFLISLCLFLLTRAWSLRQESRSDRWVYATVLVQIVWVNTHGLFPLGPIMIGSFLVSDILSRKTFRNPYFTLFILSSLVCFINPYGLTGVLWPAHLFTVLRDPFYHQTIEETRNALAETVWLRDAWALSIWLVLLLFQLVTFVFRSDRKQLIEKYSAGYFVSAVALAWLAISARRNISILVIWTAPFLIDYLILNFSYFKNNLKQEFFKRRLLPVLVFFLVGLTCFGIITNLVSNNQSATRFGAGLRASRFPDRATDFLNKFPTDARIFADTQFANYAIFKVARFQSYIDSRYAEIYDVEHLKTYLSALGNSSVFEQELKRYNFKIVALTFDASSQALIRYLKSQQAWSLVFYDELSVIFAKKDFAQNWLGTNLNQSVENHFQNSLSRIKLQMSEPDWLDHFSFKYKLNDQVWSYVQLIESSLLIGNIEGAKQVDALARQLVPNSPTVKSTHCETMYFDYVYKLQAGQMNKSSLSVLSSRSAEACEQALLANPQALTFREFIVFMKLNDGQVEGAIEEFKKIFKATKRRDVLLKIAELEMIQKRYLSAFGYYQQAQIMQNDPAIEIKMTELKERGQF